MKWFDKPSPSYIKYLGYQIWVSPAQRDVFTPELAGKIDYPIKILSTRQLALYGRAHLANTLILSKLWHILRTVEFPKHIVKKWPTNI